MKCENCKRKDGCVVLEDFHRKAEKVKNYVSFIFDQDKHQPIDNIVEKMGIDLALFNNDDELMTMGKAVPMSLNIEFIIDHCLFFAENKVCPHCGGLIDE